MMLLAALLIGVIVGALLQEAFYVLDYAESWIARLRKLWRR